MNIGKKNIIMVDGNHANPATSNNNLKKYYIVVSLSSGVKLLKILEKKIIDLILLDIDMQEINCYETITHIKSVKMFV